MSSIFANNSHLIFGKTSSVVGEGFIPPLIEKPPPCGQRIQGGGNGLEIFRQGKSCLSLPNGWFIPPGSTPFPPYARTGQWGAWGRRTPRGRVSFQVLFLLLSWSHLDVSMRGFLRDIQFSTVNKMDIANLCRIDSSPEIVNFLQSPLYFYPDHVILTCSKLHFIWKP